MSRKQEWRQWGSLLFGSLKPAGKAPRRRPRRAVRLEPLEERTMFSVDLRSIDGTGNNVAHPQWGSNDEDFLRKARAEYGDGISTPSGADRPSARAVSNALAAQGPDDILNDRDMSAYVYAWGQFIDHDIDLTNSSTDPSQSFPISVPLGDPYFDPNSTGTKTIPLSRSDFDSATGTTNPRQQVNAITAFIDGSMVYGSDTARATALRTLEGGRLKTSNGNLLPFNTMNLPNGGGPGDPATFFVAGDIRANENPDLQALQTLFMREHNRVATDLVTKHPDWTDEQLYQQARRVVIAEIQAITYNEFLPALLGQQAIQPYHGYNPHVNPGIANEFAAAAYRLGHSLVGSDVEFLDNNGDPVRGEVALRDAFFNDSFVEETGIDPVLKYLASDRAQEVDPKVVDDLQNFLFGPPGAGGFDLAALNIQRGRDHGLADYNATRAAYGLKPVKSISDITSDPSVQQALRTTYGDVNNIDLWVGALAEDHVKGASVGPLLQRILSDQFQRLRDGDRFYYENDFQGPQLAQLRNTTLANVIKWNTSVTNLQDNVFFFHASVTGRVLVSDGPSSPPTALVGVMVQLQDTNGSILAQTKTDKNGVYSFDHLDLGSYRVVITQPSGLQVVSTSSSSVDLTRGDQPINVDFVLSRTKPPAPPQDPRSNPPKNSPPPPMHIEGTLPPPSGPAAKGPAGSQPRK